MPFMTSNQGKFKILRVSLTRSKLWQKKISKRLLKTCIINKKLLRNVDLTKQILIEIVIYAKDRVINAFFGTRCECILSLEVVGWAWQYTIGCLKKHLSDLYTTFFIRDYEIHYRLLWNWLFHGPLPICHVKNTDSSWHVSWFQFRVSKRPV